MTDIIRLAEESIGAFLVGKKVLNAKYEIARYTMFREASRLISSAISLLFFGLGIFVLSIMILFGLGLWMADLYNNQALIILVPTGLLCFFLVLLWWKRDLMFRSFARQIIKDLIA